MYFWMMHHGAFDEAASDAGLFVLNKSTNEKKGANDNNIFAVNYCF